MKKLLPLIVPVILFITIGLSSLYITTIMFIQTVPQDSLAIGHDRSLHEGDTVTITGRVVAPPRVNFSGGDHRVLLRGLNSRQSYIQDTSNALFGGIIIRQADTVSNTLFDQLDSGMKVTVHGIVQEFSGGNTPNTTTQLKLDTLSQVQILPTIKRRPAPIQVNVSDFDSLGNVKFTTGEKYEGMYVQLNNLTVGLQGGGQRHIRSLYDAQGNRIYLRDFSNFFSVGPTPSYGWTPWVPASVGATVTSIRGVIIEGAYNTDGTFNGGAAYPYVIVPIYPNDLTMGNTPPFISTVSRNPGVPKPTDNVQVTAVAVDTLDNEMSIATVELFYRINHGSYSSISMTPSGSIYSATITSRPLGTLVEYFIKATDNLGGVRTNPSDTSRSSYFYYVRNSDTMTIKDVQYTPNNGGFSAWNGYTVTTEGVVTADTSDFPAYTFTGPGGTQTVARKVMIQDPAIAGGWSGIWITGTPTDILVRGQRVRVRGQVTEVNGCTSIAVATPGDMVIVSSGNVLPNPEILLPSVVADTKIDGDTTVEKWESVLIRFQNQAVITCINASSSSACTSTLPLPDTSFRRNFGEMFVKYTTDSSFARVSLQDGSHNFVNGWDPAQANQYDTTLPGHLLHGWDGINGLTGVLFFDFGKYRLLPRKISDFGTVIGVEPISEVASSFWLRQNYPNPFNPTTQIVYNIPLDAVVTLKVYNLLGQEVKTLINGIQYRGKYSIPFDAKNYASGLYFYVLEADAISSGQKFREAKKMVLVK
jgi:hypothetical protein